mgnify:FL=1|jgi:Predicted Zn-dependent hydrolases of the beta-lactamase fold
MRIQLIRHATLWLEYAGVNFLIDPMFSPQGANPPIIKTDNDRRNPLVPLPGPVDAWLAPDAVIVTHLHQDHWDAAAAQALPKTAPILCQPGNREPILTAGFTDVTEIADTTTYRSVRIHRTNGQHGTGEIGQWMGKVSGFVFEADGEPTLYIAGDTIWCEDVKAALDTYRPERTVVNAGGARFVAGDPITMDADDVIKVVRYAPYTQVIPVHMDSINHCHVTRDVLRAKLAEQQLIGQVVVLEDGEWL